MNVSCARVSSAHTHISVCVCSWLVTVCGGVCHCLYSSAKSKQVCHLLWHVYVCVYVCVCVCNATDVCVCVCFM